MPPPSWPQLGTAIGRDARLPFPATCLRIAFNAVHSYVICLANKFSRLLGDGRHGDRCALQRTTLYYGWLLPMSAIILHNLVVFGLVLRVLGRKQPGGTQFTVVHS